MVHLRWRKRTEIYVHTTSLVLENREKNEAPDKLREQVYPSPVQFHLIFSFDSAFVNSTVILIKMLFQPAHLAIEEKQSRAMKPHM